MLDVDFLENFIKGIFDDWFAGRNICDEKAVANLAKQKFLACI